MKRLIVARLFSLLALAGLLLGTSGPLHSDPLPLPEPVQARVNNAIEKGVAFLLKSQYPSGTWAQKDAHTVGYAALPGLTLLECGVPANNPFVQKAAQFVRFNTAKLDGTYEIALSILFLDRLGDPQDKTIIQVMAMRLVAGQTMTGGWGYRCPVLDQFQHTELLTLLRKLDPPILENLLAAPQKGLPNMLPGGQPGMNNPLGKDGKFDNPLGKGGEKDKFGQVIPGKGSSSSSGSQTPIHKKGDKGAKDPKGQLLDVPLDRVNVQNWERPPLRFPTVGVRAGLCLKAEEAPNPDFIPKKLAMKPKAPVKIPFKFAMVPVVQPPEFVPLVELEAAKFKDLPPYLGSTDNSNTQFAILGLWTARRHDVPTERSLGLLLRRYVTSQEANGGWGYAYKFNGGAGASPAMTCVGLLGLAVGHGLAKELDGPLRDIIANDPRILNGFVSLAPSIGQPTGRFENLPMQNLYYLWALERVSVLYNLPTIGGRDWYRWSAEILIANQNPEWGNWDKGGYPGAAPALDTCFALLVLKRANLAKDLAANLPFDAAKLNQQIADRIGGVIVEKKEPSPPPPPPPVVNTPAPKEDPLPNPLPKQEPTPQPPSTTTPAAATQAPTPAPAASGMPWWIWALIGLGILLLAAILVYFLTQRKSTDEEDDEDEDRPRKRKRGAEVADEEERPRKRKRDLEVVEEEEPPRKRKRDVEVVEEAEPPRKQKRFRDPD